jgi:hypothetical protein
VVGYAGRAELEKAVFAGNRCQSGELQLATAHKQERDMTFKWIAIAAIGLVAGLIAADPASARAKHPKQLKHKVARACVEQPQVFTFGGIFSNRAPQPNGCAPAVYARGRYVGQDPDPFIRSQLLRDPDTGYHPEN